MDRDDIIAEVKSQLLKELESYKEQLQKFLPPEAQEQFGKAREESTEFIKENPWTSVALAAALGFMLGRLFYRQGDE